MGGSYRSAPPRQQRCPSSRPSAREPRRGSGGAARLRLQLFAPSAPFGFRSDLDVGTLESQVSLIAKPRGAEVSREPSHILVLYCTTLHRLTLAAGPCPGGSTHSRQSAEQRQVRHLAAPYCFFFFFFFASSLEGDERPR